MRSKPISRQGTENVIKATNLQSLLNKKETAVINVDELKRIKNTANELSNEEKQSQRKVLEEQKQQQRATANARKQKIIDKEEQRKKNIQKTDLEIEDDMKRKVLNDRATQIKLEEHDEVKHMNQQMIYAKCVTIREKQLDEKKNIFLEIQEEEERLDLMMEIERLKVMKKLEDEEVVKVDQRKKGAEIIKKQIKEREQIRLKHQEIKDRESQQMLKQIQLLEEDEKREADRKQNRQKEMMEEVKKAN